MERVKLEALDREVSRVGLGTWSIGGLLWGGTPDEQAVRTIGAALDAGIDLIDTAPAYGRGKAEHHIARAIRERGDRDSVVIATKAGLAWGWLGGTYRDARPRSIEKEVEASLRRLETDYIDLYQVHWPDPRVPIEATAEAMERLHSRGLVRAVGVSNFSVEQIERFRTASPLHAVQPPYNLFERGIERELLPYCREAGIAVIAYGPLCRGLLSGAVTLSTTFPEDDIRSIDPKFRPPRLAGYLEAVRRLADLARVRWDRGVGHLAVRWVLRQPGVTVVLLGARRPDHLGLLDRLFGWELDDDALREVAAILAAIREPVGPEFLAPPLRDD